MALIDTRNRFNEQKMPPPLPRFRHINRYWDPRNDYFAAKILPGEFYVTVKDELVTTVLGSCVSACIRDTVFRIGGMNHFMLPADKSALHSYKRDTSNAYRYGNYAMEALINEILSNGGRRENLEIKIFGGGKIIQHMTNIGQLNIAFVRDYLEQEDFEIVCEDLGDVYPRKVIYYPMTGRVRVKRLQSLHNNTIVERENSYRDNLVKEPVAGDVELF